jgi:hypothetical protein
MPEDCPAIFPANLLLPQLNSKHFVLLSSISDYFWFARQGCGTQLPRALYICATRAGVAQAIRVPFSGRAASTARTRLVAATRVEYSTAVGGPRGGWARFERTHLGARVPHLRGLCEGGVIRFVSRVLAGQVPGARVPRLRGWCEGGVVRASSRLFAGQVPGVAVQAPVRPQLQRGGLLLRHLVRGRSLGFGLAGIHALARGRTNLGRLAVGAARFPGNLRFAMLIRHSAILHPAAINASRSETRPPGSIALGIGPPRCRSALSCAVLREGMR